MTKMKAFTLIELLIVVAIIAILAAIAVPNFLEAQTRSKVSRVAADTRTVATALEAYAVDNNKYPFDEQHDATESINSLDGFFIEHQFRLTTPIAYISSVDIIDPFIGKETVFPGNQVGKSFRYYNYGYGGDGSNWGEQPLFVSRPDIPLPRPGYALTSLGPDRADDGGEWIGIGLDQSGAGEVSVDRLYDASNGTVSEGDLVRTGGTSVLGNLQD